MTTAVIWIILNGMRLRLLPSGNVGAASPSGQVSLDTSKIEPRFIFSGIWAVSELLLSFVSLRSSSPLTAPLALTAATIAFIVRGYVRIW